MKQPQFMKKIKLSAPLIALILVNLMILFQAIYSGLDTVSILLVYWTESVIIGFFIVLKMLFSKKEENGAPSLIAKLLGIPFFIVHYSLFLFVHLVFIIALGSNLAPNTNILGYLLSFKEVWIYSLLLFLSHLVSFIFNFIIPKEYEKTDPWNLMLSPYSRVILMQLTLVLGAGLVVLTGNPKSMIFLLFIPLKIVFDIYSHVKEHRE